MSIRNKACIVGAFEHPTRFAPDKSLAQLHAELAIGAIADAGLTKNDIDGIFCDSDAPGTGALSLIEYLGKIDGKWVAIPATPGSQIKGPCGRIDLLKQHAGLDIVKMYPAGAAADKAMADKWTWDAFLDAAVKGGKNPALRKAAERVRSKMTAKSRR